MYTCLYIFSHFSNRHGLTAKHNCCGACCCASMVYVSDLGMCRTSSACTYTSSSCILLSSCDASKKVQDTHKCQNKSQTHSTLSLAFHSKSANQAQITEVHTQSHTQVICFLSHKQMFSLALAQHVYSTSFPKSADLFSSGMIRLLALDVIR